MAIGEEFVQGFIGGQQHRQQQEQAKRAPVLALLGRSLDDDNLTFDEKRSVADHLATLLDPKGKQGVADALHQGLNLDRLIGTYLPDAQGQIPKTATPQRIGSLSPLDLQTSRANQQFLGQKSFLHDAKMDELAVQDEYAQAKERRKQAAALQFESFRQTNREEMERLRQGGAVDKPLLQLAGQLKANGSALTDDEARRMAGDLLVANYKSGTARNDAQAEYFRASADSRATQDEINQRRVALAEEMAQRGWLKDDYLLQLARGNYDRATSDSIARDVAQAAEFQKQASEYLFRAQVADAQGTAEGSALAEQYRQAAANQQRAAEQFTVEVQRRYGQAAPAPPPQLTAPLPAPTRPTGNNRSGLIGVRPLP